MIWKEQVECASPADLKNLQSDYLRKLTSYIYNNCPVYKKKIDEAGVKPEDVKSIEDIKKLPFTTKVDMRDHYPYGLFSAGQSEVREIHVSSGTTGNPTLMLCRSRTRRYYSDCIRLRIVYRRSWIPLRRDGNGIEDNTDLCGPDRPAVENYAGIQAAYYRLHSELCPFYG